METASFTGTASIPEMQLTGDEKTMAILSHILAHLDNLKC